MDLGLKSHIFPVLANPKPPDYQPLFGSRLGRIRYMNTRLINLAASSLQSDTVTLYDLEEARSKSKKKKKYSKSNGYVLSFYSTDFFCERNIMFLTRMSTTMIRWVERRNSASPGWHQSSAAKKANTLVARYSQWQFLRCRVDTSRNDPSPTFFEALWGCLNNQYQQHAIL